MNTPVRGWPTETAAWPDAPKSLLPGTLQAWPKGANRRHSDAERILNQAVAYWDVEAFREGDRFLRNLGTAGDVLDLRLGSSIDPNTNDPKFLQAGSEGYVYLPGGSGNFLSVPDEAALDITGDIDIRVRVALDDWTPSALMMLVNKRTTTTSNYAWTLYVGTDGKLNLAWSTTGTGISATATTSVASGIADGAAKWVRVTLDVDNGAVGNDTKFYLSDDGAAWTQLGDTITTAGVTSVNASTANVVFGAGNDAGTTNLLAGKFYRAIIKDGIDGPTVLDVDCSLLTDGSQTSFQARTDQTVTINRSTSGRKSVVVPSTTVKMTPDGVFRRGRSVMLFGTDDYLEVVDNLQQSLVDFGVSDSFTVLFIGRRFATAATAFLLNKTTHNVAASLVAGWWLYQSSSLAANFRLADGTNGVAPSLGTSAAGALTVHAAVRDVVADTVETFRGGASQTSVTDTTTGASSNSGFLRIGTSNGTASSFYDGEFVAAAVFRRALSQSEIQTITDYFTGSVAQGDTEIAATDILAGSVFWIDANRSGVV